MELFRSGHVEEVNLPVFALLVSLVNIFRASAGNGASGRPLRSGGGVEL